MHTFTRKRNRFPVITTLTFAGLLAGAGLSPSWANVLYNSPTHYDESKTMATCGTKNTCTLAFRKVAAGKTLLITHVSCRIVAKSTVAPLTSEVLSDSVGNNRDYLTPVLLSTDGQNVQYFHSSNDVSTIFTGGFAPEVAVTFDGSIPIPLLACNIAGQYL